MVHVYKFNITICPLFMGEKKTIRESKEIVKSKLEDAFISCKIGVVTKIKFHYIEPKSYYATMQLIPHKKFVEDNPSICSFQEKIYHFNYDVIYRFDFEYEEKYITSQIEVDFESVVFNSLR
jgi:hypothetical protein